jgi:uncharacterized protein YraI
MKKLSLLLTGLLALPAVASAETAWTTDYVNLRSGPDVDYPRVTYLHPGEPVEVYGCVEDYSWCDVDASGERGWVSAQYLDFEYDGARVRVDRYGPQIGLAVVSFALATYWDLHYHHRPWYPQLGYYRVRHPHHWAPPPPRHYARPAIVRPHAPPRPNGGYAGHGPQHDRNRWQGPGNSPRQDRPWREGRPQQIGQRPDRGGHEGPRGPGNARPDRNEGPRQQRPQGAPQVGQAQRPMPPVRVAEGRPSAGPDRGVQGPRPPAPQVRAEGPRQGGGEQRLQRMERPAGLERAQGFQRPESGMARVQPAPRPSANPAATAAARPQAPQAAPPQQQREAPQGSPRVTRDSRGDSGRGGHGAREGMRGNRVPPSMGMR